ncbi:MAG: hypothetical protein AAF268_06995 [Cyanobacteria bacterium P01_A01_bin.3]
MNGAKLAIALLAVSTGLTTAAIAEPIGVGPEPDIIAQFNINPPGPSSVRVNTGVRNTGSSDESDSDDSGARQAGSGESTPVAANSAVFSGQSSPYLDDYNGFALDVPTEFTLGNNGQTSDWQGPILDGSGTLIYVNAAPIPGVPAQMLCDANFQQYQQDRFYTEVEPVDIYFEVEGQQPVRVPAFRAKEVDNQRGSRDSKLPDDIHRWHLFVFGNDRTYTFGFTGAFQTFQDNDVQALYDDVISSVRLVPIVE